MIARRFSKTAFVLFLAIQGGSPRAQPAAERAVEGAAGHLPPVVTIRPPVNPTLLPGWNAYPGEFALRTLKGFYVTAINGGGRISDPVIVTAATKAGPWEKFRIAVFEPPPSHDKSIQASGGGYLTAVSGGGRITDVMHTDATQVNLWEQFRFFDLSEGGVAPTYFAIQTIKGSYLTAVGEGGKYEDAIHTDASTISQWEYFRLVKCGDLGTGYQYTILPANDQALTAVNGGGLDKGDTIVMGYWPGDTRDRGWSRFTFMRQNDGSYALQTPNGRNFVTALGGGGKVQEYFPPDCGPIFGACIGSFSTIFHTDATRVLGWEKFKFIDQGDCKYAIQTSSGFFVGIYKHPSGYILLTTRRSTVSSENETFQLVMYGLASPVVLH